MPSNVVDLPAERGRRRRPMNGRAYFEELERKLHIDGLDPEAVRDAEQTKPPLKRGTEKSRVGGRITQDLKRLTPAEVEERRARSEAFLRQPAREVPGEQPEANES